MHADVEHRARVLEAAETRRAAARALRTIDAYRLLPSVAEGGPTAPAEIAIDRYLDVVVVTHRDSWPDAEIEAWCDAALTAFSPEAIVVKTMAKRPGDSRSRCVYGRLPAMPLRIREDDAVFLCELDDGVQTGLFLDHQETRFEARRYAAGVEVLNLFAYTCAFSVHAALAGAVRVTSVDVSRRALDRGRANMAASGLDPDRHRWFTDDVLDHLGKKRGPEYGLILMDPPVFGRSKKRAFSLATEQDRLLEGALAKLAPEGMLLFSTHATHHDLAALVASMARHPAEVVASRTVGDLKLVWMKKKAPATR